MVSLGVAMRPADDRDEAGLRDVARANDLGRADFQRQILGSGDLESAESRVADEGPRLGGRQNHAANRAGLFDERDIDSELAVLFQELLGPVQGIDQEKARRGW